MKKPLLASLLLLLAATFAGYAADRISANIHNKAFLLAMAAPVIEHSLTNAETATVTAPVEFTKLGSTVVPERLKLHLDSVAAILEQYPEIRVVVAGHTCAIGSEKVNKRVGQKRALAVAAYLKSKGIAEHRLTIHSFGKSVPIADNDSEAGRSRNRRVEVELIQ